jgi:hypothetical protein
MCGSNRQVSTTLNGLDPARTEDEFIILFIEITTFQSLKRVK